MHIILHTSSKNSTQTEILHTVHILDTLLKKMCTLVIFSHFVTITTS